MREGLINGDILCSKKEALRRLKYTLDQDPREFVSMVRDAMRIMKPGLTSSELCEKVLDRLPIRLARKIEDLGVVNQLDRIVKVMIRSHEEYLEGEHSLRKKRFRNWFDNYRKGIIKRKDLSGYPQKNFNEDTTDHRDHKSKHQLRSNRISDQICYNCNRRGDTLKSCWFSRKEDQNNEEKKKEELRPEIKIDYQRKNVK